MKVFCRFCGIHFPQDFEETLKPTCNFWGDRGLGNLPLELKKELWAWLVSVPADKIYEQAGVTLFTTLKGEPAVEAIKFLTLVPNWEALTETQRQAYERLYFKMQAMGVKKPDHQKIMVEVMKVKEKVVN